MLNPFKLKPTISAPSDGPPANPGAEWKILISAFFALVLPIFLYTSWVMGKFSFPDWSWLLWLYPAPFFLLAWGVYQKHRGWTIFGFWYFLIGGLAMTGLHRGGIFWVFFFTYTFWLGLHGMKQLRRDRLSFENANKPFVKESGTNSPNLSSVPVAPTFKVTMSWAYWLRQTFRQYFSLKGRAPRREYWFFALFYVLILLTAILIDRHTGWHTKDLVFSPTVTFAGVGYVYLSCFLLLFIPKYTVMVRRLHDRNLKGWWVFLSIIPLLGWLILLIIACRRSYQGANRFGPPPLPVN